MQLTVILPCFNGAETIGVQLEALTRQDWPDGWEVVVVDNGSTDASMDIVERYRGRLPDLRIVEAYEPPGPRKGVAHSYTVGLAAARGDAFVFCEADDEVGEGWLHALGSALRAHPFVAAALEYERLNAPALLAPGWRQQSVEAGLSTLAGPLFLPFASGCSLGLRREVYALIGTPDLTCGASWDTDYCWRAHRAHVPLTFVPSACVHYRLRSTLRASYQQAMSWGRAHVVLAHKYAPTSSRVRLAKRAASSAFDLVKQTTSVAKVATRRESVRAWLWGMGWCIGELQGRADQLDAMLRGAL